MFYHGIETYSVKKPPVGVKILLREIRVPKSSHFPLQMKVCFDPHRRYNILIKLSEYQTWII